MSPRTTRPKNKSSHPGAPDMTPSQRTLAGIAPPKKKQPSKDQQIAALKDELHAAQCQGHSTHDAPSELKTRKSS